MGKVLEVSEETYHQLAELAERQQRTVEEMLRLCLATYIAQSLNVSRRALYRAFALAQ